MVSNVGNFGTAVAKYQIVGIGVIYRNFGLSRFYLVKLKKNTIFFQGRI